MSFLYPRTVSLTRPAQVNIAGDAGYLGPEATTETVVTGGPGGTTPLTAIAAGIQLASGGGRPLAGVPSDTEHRSTWNIFLGASLGLVPQQVRRNDIATDDAGLRYQINAAYYTPLGVQLQVELLPN